MSDTPDEKRATVKEILEKLNRQEQTTGRSGAVSRAPKGKLLEFGELPTLNPDKHYRRVNTTDVAKLQTRIEQGYERVPEDEAKKAGTQVTVGETVLMALPREKAEERRKEIKELGQRRLKAHKTDVREAAENVARELRRHGIDMPIERLLVDEG